MKAAPKPAKKTSKAAKAAKPTRPDVKVFIAEYLKDSNGRRAAIAAGYSANSADSQASRLLKNAKVRAQVDSHAAERLEKVKAETGITLERTLREIGRIAFFDPRRLFDPTGNPLHITDLDEQTAAVVAGLDVLEEWEGSGQDRILVGHVKKWKLADKKGALDMLMKHLGGYKVDNDQKKPELAEQLSQFFGALHENAAGRLPIAAQRKRP